MLRKIQQFYSKISLFKLNIQTVPNTYNFAWYWSSELMEANGSGSDYYAYILIDSPTGGLMVKDTQRIQGLAVRAVVKKQ